MRVARWLAFAGFALAATAQAAEEADLSGRPRGFTAKSVETSNLTAPFVSRAEPASEMSLGAPALSSGRSVPCADGLTALCYDANNRGLIYRGARDFMPRVDGLTPEGVALRRDRLILRYSFR
jgi:hypothetical protein